MDTNCKITEVSTKVGAPKEAGMIKLRILLICASVATMASAADAQQAYQVGTYAQTGGSFSFFPSASYNTVTPGGYFGDQYQQVTPPAAPAIVSGNLAILNNNYVTDNYSATGQGKTSFDLSGPVGGATSAYSSSTFSDSNSKMGNAWAGADLATGSLQVFALGNRVGNCVNEQSCGSGNSEAYLQDSLNFKVAGATATTITPISVTFAMDGVPSGNYPQNYPAASWTMGAYFGNASMAPFRSDYGLSWCYDNTAGIYEVSPLGQTKPQGWQSFSFSAFSPDKIVFTGIYDLIGESATVGIGLNFRAWATDGATLDYSNNAGVSLTLPGNVSYTSASGVFLTGSPAVGGVPEPATWAMMIVGFGFVGAVLRRKRTVTRFS